jgi:tetratricopeptide (TPR) repeat protein
MKVLAAIILLCSGLRAAECTAPHLGEKETLARFQELDRAAQSAFDGGKYADAARNYREAACLVPKSARAFYGLGIAEGAAGNFKAARSALETAYSLLPDNKMPLAMLVRVNVAMHDVEQVKAVLRRAAGRFPNDVELHSGLARFLAENQLLDLALAESLRSGQAGATDAASAVALAALEQTVGAYEDSIRLAAGVQEQAGVPDSIKASAAGVAGLSYESIGRRDEAIEHLRASIALAPTQENSYLALAFLYQKAQRFKDAVEVLQQGRQRVPDSAGFLLPLGNNLVWAEQYQAGIENLNELLRKAPGTEEAYVRLAEAYRNTGRPEQEVQTLRRLAAMKPGYPMLHVLTARAMLMIDPADHPAVLAELVQAEKRTPNDAEIFYLRGKCYLAMNQPREAVAALEHAIELAPLDPGPYYQLAMTYRRLGQTEAARRILDRMQFLKQPATQ